MADELIKLLVKLNEENESRILTPGWYLIDGYENVYNYLSSNFSHDFVEAIYNKCSFDSGIDSEPDSMVFRYSGNHIEEFLFGIKDIENSYSNDPEHSYFSNALVNIDDLDDKDLNDELDGFINAKGGKLKKLSDYQVEVWERNYK